MSLQVPRISTTSWTQRRRELKLWIQRNKPFWEESMSSKRKVKELRSKYLIKTLKWFSCRASNRSNLMILKLLRCWRSWRRDAEDTWDSFMNLSNRSRRSMMFRSKLHLLNSWDTLLLILLKLGNIVLISWKKKGYRKIYLC